MTYPDIIQDKLRNSVQTTKELNYEHSFHKVENLKSESQTRGFLTLFNFLFQENIPAIPTCSDARFVVVGRLSPDDAAS